MVARREARPFLDAPRPERCASFAKSSRESSGRRRGRCSAVTIPASSSTRNIVNVSRKVFSLISASSCVLCAVSAGCCHLQRHSIARACT